MMRHIRLVGTRENVAVADAGLKGISCTLCTIKNGGDRDACVDSGKCGIMVELP